MNVDKQIAELERTCTELSNAVQSLAALLESQGRQVAVLELQVAALAEQRDNAAAPASALTDGDAEDAEDDDVAKRLWRAGNDGEASK